MTEGPTSATSMWTSEPRQTQKRGQGRFSIVAPPPRPGQLETSSVTALGRTRHDCFSLRASYLESHVHLSRMIDHGHCRSWEASCNQTAVVPV